MINPYFTLTDEISAFYRAAMLDEDFNQDQDIWTGYEI